MLDKLTGRFAPRPSTGPHKLRECLPLVVFLRNRLKYALTYHETKMILKQRQVLVDNKVRTELCYPAGFMDVISIPKTKENFRLLFDHKGRYAVNKINAEEAKFKLCKVKKMALTEKGIPTLLTHDGRTLRYPDPTAKLHDTVKLDLSTGKVISVIKFDVGAQVMVTGGRNTGRVGIITSRERHPGSFDIVHIKDNADSSFATRLGNCFAIASGKGKSQIALPKQGGIKRSIAEERDLRMAARAKASSA
jgi:small subunit ribosomal protein S4e